MDKNISSKKSRKRFFKKCVIYTIMFCIVFTIALFTNLPMYFDSYVQIENYRITAHFWLIIYRLIMYFSFPVIISIIEKAKFNKGIRFKILLIENFNVQFATYALIASFYALFGVDRVLGVDIFSTSDAFLFMTGFIITTIINGGIPDLILS